MPHQKHLSHPNLLETFCQSIAKASNSGYNVPSVIKVEKSDSGYKKYTHRQNDSHAMSNMYSKDKQKSYERDSNDRILTENSQKKLIPLKKKQKLVFYEQKYTEQIYRLSSNLCVKQIQKEKEQHKIGQRNTSCDVFLDRRLNSFLQNKKLTKRRHISPLKKFTHQNIITIDENYRQFNEKYFGNYKKLRFHTKLKPLADVDNIDFSNIQSHQLYQRSHFGNSVLERAYFSDTRGHSVEKGHESLLKQLMARQEDIQPWQNSNSQIENDQKFDSNFNLNLES